MNKIVKPYIISLISFIAGIVFYLLSIGLDFDVFELLYEFSRRSEHRELDELIILLFLLVTGISVDIYRKYDREKEAVLVANSKMESLHTTIRTVQNIVGNSMNSLVLYNMEAKKTGGLSDKTIAELDELIHTTMGNINKIASMEEIREKQLGDEMYVLDFADQEEKSP